MAGFIRHTQNTLCQKACVHDGGFGREGGGCSRGTSAGATFRFLDQKDRRDKMLVAASV